MTHHVTSADGTSIAYDQLGDGPPVVVIGGLFNTRQTTTALAEALAERFTVLNPDRRGRGDSGDTAPYAVAREIEDVAALIQAAGGPAAVYGHSSGAGLALEAAAAGLPISRLVLHEPPYGDDDEESRRRATEMAEAVGKAIAEGRPGDAIRTFFADMGMPAEMVDGMSNEPGMLAVASTMPYDMAVMGEADGGTIPEGRARAVAVPTLVLAGDASEPFFRETAARLTELLADARYEVLPGADHGAPPELVAPAVTTFLAG